MDERALRRAFHAAFDGDRPSPGAEDRAFDAVAARGARGDAARRRLAGVGAVALSLLTVATLLLGRGTVLAPSSTAPAPPPALPSQGASWAPPVPAGGGVVVNGVPGEVAAAIDDRVALAGWARTGAVYLTLDGGVTWTPVRVPHGPEPALADLEWVDADTAFAATSTGLYRFQISTGAWTALASRGDLVRLDFVDGKSGYAVTASGDVVASEDGGLSFGTLDVGIHPVTWLQWVSPAKAWAAGPDGITATADGGATWARQLSLPAEGDPSSPRLVAQVGFRDESNGFAIFDLNGVAASSAAFVVYHTTDGGAHWAAEGCTCGTVPVPGWLRQGARAGAPDVPHSALVVTGPDQAVLLGGSSTASTTSVCVTADAGRGWTCRPAPYRGGGSASLSVKGRTWWLVADAGASGPLTAVSQDAGATWTVRHPS